MNEKIIPINPPSIANLNGAELAANQGRQVRLTEPTPADVGLMKIDRDTCRKLIQYGIEAETIGMARLASGATLVTQERYVDIIEKVSECMAESADPESVSMLANAYASLMKAHASMIKAAGGISAVEKPHKGRKSFAKGQKIGPVLDVKS